MIAELKEKCDLLVQNKKILQDAFKWEAGLMSLTAATLYTDSGMPVDVEQLKSCETTMKEKTGIFSEFRGKAKMPLLCKMALSNDPEKYFTNVEKLYGLLNKSKWIGDEYKIMAAITLCDHADESEYVAAVDRTNEIYSRMKQEHKWITSNEDIPFAAILAVSSLDIDRLIYEMEKNYRLLKDSFHNSNAVQSLSHILALDEHMADEKCARIVSLFNELKAIKHRFGTSYELVTLGTLTLLDLPEKEIAALIAEVDDYLKGQKGFGTLSLSANERRLFAAQLVLKQYGPKPNPGDSAVLGSVLALTIAAEISMTLCITCCISASAASH